MRTAPITAASEYLPLRMRARVGTILAAATLLAGAAAPAAHAASAPWRIGAAKADITPPPFDAAQDLKDFPETDPARQTVCPRSTYNGPRLWRFEEPYQDSDHSGEFNYADPSNPRSTGDQYCDYNHNGRWDGIYLSGGTNHLAKSVHDPIDARAIAFSYGSKTVVLASVISQGMFNTYIDPARAEAETLAQQGSHKSTCGHIDEMVVSSNHNESSPDPIGLYGAPPVPNAPAGAHSGIDDYYMDWLDHQIATAAVQACDQRQAASMRETEFPIPKGLRQEIPGDRFPTADDYGKPAAIDPKVRVLQARTAGGKPIFTMMNLADHNQDIGQSSTYDVSHAVSGDWPGYFHRHLEQLTGGMAMFLAADIGSMEDAITVPAIPGPPCFSGDNGCYAQVQATGDSLADHVASSLSKARPVRPGPVGGRRTVFCVPLENNLFRGVAALGIFGRRQTYTQTAAGCVPSGRSGDQVQTSVAMLDVGPDLQFIVNPGEAFPALMLGGPWGREDASCPNRPNPPVPTWHARAAYRFQVGLGDDMIGYEKPPWSFLYDTQGSYTMTDCTSDPHNHHHGLEDESVGPTGSNLVAQKLTALLDGEPDLTAQIRLGRYVKADGSLTDAYKGPADQGAPGHFPNRAVAIWLAAPGSTTLNAQPGHPDSGTIVALPSVGRFGGRKVDATGSFMDFDGAFDPFGPGIDTRGMLVRSASGGVVRRYYVDVYPELSVSGKLGPAIRPPSPCRDRLAPRSRFRRDELHWSPERLVFKGSASDRGCSGSAAANTHSVPGKVAHVEIAVGRHLSDGDCRFLRPHRGFTTRPCSKARWLRVRGTSSWVFTRHGEFPAGSYFVLVRAIDRAGNREKVAHGNRFDFTVH